jgi:hypothetical protein
MPVTLDTTGQPVYHTGDGIYLGSTSEPGSDSACAYWNIRGVCLDSCGRCGVAIIDGKYITVTECHITQNGFPGIDLEPNGPTQSIWGVRIVNNTFRHNEVGIVLHTGKTSNKQPVVILGNTFEGNRSGAIRQDDLEIAVAEMANVLDGSVQT